MMPCDDKTRQKKKKKEGMGKLSTSVREHEAMDENWFGSTYVASTRTG
jgi:hypothetical protein